MEYFKAEYFPEYFVKNDLHPIIYDRMEDNLPSLNINKSLSMPLVTSRSQLPVGYHFI